MYFVSVVTRPHFSVAMPPQFRRALLASSVALSLIACDSDSPGTQLPAAPTPVPATTTGVFEGTVSDTVTGRRLDGVTVEAIRGPGAGRTTLTNEAGLFLLDLPSGDTTFRWSKPGYVSRDANYTVAPGETTFVTVALQTPPASGAFPGPPYTVTGTVTDSNRVPIAGAEVWVYGQMSPIDNRYATGFTDANGRYTLTSQRAPQQVRAIKAGYVTRDILTLPPPVITSTATWTVDVAIPRIMHYRLLFSSFIKVGQTARMEAYAELDDGSSSSGLLYMQLSSSDPSIARVDTGWVHGVAPGTATVTGTYYGVPASLQIRVDP